MSEYDASYGNCEVHTEYFACGNCNTEVKQSLKNISLHLRNVHNFSPAAYEQQFVKLVKEHAVIGVGPVGEGDQQQQHRQLENTAGRDEVHSNDKEDSDCMTRSLKAKDVSSLPI